MNLLRLCLNLLHKPVNIGEILKPKAESLHAATREQKEAAERLVDAIAEYHNDDVFAQMIEDLKRKRH